MSANAYDISLDGISLRIDRETRDSYIRGWERVSFQEQVVGATTREMATSRPDLRVMHQTDWSGGATWWKPILSAETADYYYVSNNMNAWNTPGLVFPVNKLTLLTTATLKNTRLFRRWRNVYTLGTTKTQTTDCYDVLKWSPATGDWSVLDDDVSSATKSDTIHDMITRVPTGFTFVLSKTKLNRFRLAAAEENVDWVDLDPDRSVCAGMRIMRNGRVMLYYNGEIYECELTGSGVGATGELVEIADDGMGEDMLTQGTDFTADDKVFNENDIQLFDAGADGVYWVHNVHENGRARPWIFKLDRDATGADIVTPLGSLPAGVVVLNAVLHLGSLVMTATPDLVHCLNNDMSRGFPRIDVYHYTQGYIGLIGSFERKSTGATESPFRIMGSDGPVLFFGSHKQIWAYDAIKGGLHTWLNMPDLATGVWRDLAESERPLNYGPQYLINSNGITYRLELQQADPTTVAAFDTDDTTYYLESNYFDFQLPLEQKTLVSCAMQTEALNANQQYRLYVSVDDGAWTKVLTHTNATVSEASIATSSLTGRRFRYKFIFETKTAAIPGVMAIEFKAQTGYMLPTWQLRFDAGSAVNAEGAPIRPEDVYDAFVTSAQKEVPVTLIDYFTSAERSDYETSTVKFQNVQIIKNAPGEAIIEVALLGV